MTRLGIVVALVVVAACSADEPPRSRSSEAAPERAPPPTATPAPIDAPAPAAPACDQLSRAACLASTGCTLHAVASMKYECRPDQGPCEVGIGQNDRVACQAVVGCTWVPADCYCPFPGYGATAVPDIVDRNGAGACGCGGGAPSMCRPQPSP